MEFGFILKKVVGHLLMPLPFMLSLLIVALLLYYSRWRQWSLRLLFLVPIALTLLAMAPVSDLFIAEYERQYHSPDINLPQNQTRWIVVLGGGGYPAEAGEPAIAQLSLPSLARITEGVRLAQLLPNAQLIVSGSGVFHSESNASIYQRAAMELGIATNRISLIKDPVDTVEEAQRLLQIVSSDPFLLVTSASHMPRAMRIMQHFNLNAIAAPADYSSHPQQRVWLDYFPAAQNLADLRRYWHEQLGQLWLSLRGM